MEIACSCFAGVSPKGYGYLVRVSSIVAFGGLQFGFATIFYSVMILFSFILIWRIMQETKGRSLEQIRKIIRTNSKRFRNTMK